MTWQLIVDGGRHKGKAIPIRRLPFLIGRGANCQLQSSATTVSQEHCSLTVRDGKLFVANCLTANGTFVNGQRLVGEGELRPGDRLAVGPLTFAVDLLPEPLPLPALDEDTVAAMLLELDREAGAASARSAEGASNPEAETAKEPALPDKDPPPAKPESPPPPPRVDSATAAEAILTQYLRRPEAVANWRKR